ncbi:unnamed protein product [Lactuca saligna]|uniref:Cation-transporting P-type ATPase N-terminal domain-containing protein n=1 Tax=Lactuca saligna TaxID=75948 RepID=A0AA35Y9M8_LACSI|nr:unnamed protein product [Lactuca saligna]
MNHDKGINDDKANILNRKNVFGSNTYPRKKGQSFWRFLFDACRDTTLIILMVAAACSLALSIKTEGNKEGWYDGGSIALAVIIVIVVTTISDYKQSLQFQNLNEEKQNIQLEVHLNGVTTFIGIVGLVVAVSLLVILLIRFFTGHTKDDTDQVEFIAGKTSLGDAVDGEIKIFTIAAAALKGGAPPGLCVKRSSQESSEAESKDVLSGELWEAKKDRVRHSRYWHDKLQNLGLFFWLEEEKKAQAERDKMLQMQVLHSSFQLLVVLLMMEAANKGNGRSRMK